MCMRRGRLLLPVQAEAAGSGPGFARWCGMRLRRMGCRVRVLHGCEIIVGTIDVDMDMAVTSA